MEKRTLSAKNGMHLVIRHANPDDSCAILNTVRSNAAERSYVLMEQYGKNVDAEKEYIGSLDGKNNLLIVAEAESDLVGCLAALQADAGLRPETRHIVHIGLHIHENFRGLGIGSKLLECSIEWADAAGFRKLQAKIFTTNSRSLSMFRKAGFVEEGVRRNSIRIGAHYVNEVLLGKTLRPHPGTGMHELFGRSLHRGAAA